MNGNGFDPYEYSCYLLEKFTFESGTTNYYSTKNHNLFASSISFFFFNIKDSIINFNYSQAQRFASKMDHFIQGTPSETRPH